MLSAQPRLSKVGGIPAPSPLHTTDTSTDPQRFSIYFDERTDIAHVNRNTGWGWEWFADFDGRTKAEQRVAEWEEGGR